jgi:hypothetical protein
MAVNANETAESRKFVDAFGPQGATWFAEGLTFAEARTEYLRTTRKERRALWMSGLSKGLARFALGCRPPGQR